MQVLEVSVGDTQIGLGEYRLRFLDFAGDRVKTITSMPTSLFRWGGLSISPDGRSMLYQERRLESDLMLVENFR